MARVLRGNYSNDKAVIITAIISQMSCENVTAVYIAFPRREFAANFIYDS